LAFFIIFFSIGDLFWNTRYEREWKEVIMSGKDKQEIIFVIRTSFEAQRGKFFWSDRERYLG